jgi:phosphomannomutase
MINPNIIRAYDIRGTYGCDLTLEDGYYLGVLLSVLLHEKALLKTSPPLVIVGFDGRNSSVSLCDHLINGLQTYGCNVINIGLAPTPIVYWAQKFFTAEACVVVTGSHNPPADNGFKITLKDGPLYADELQKINTLTLPLKKKIPEGSVQILKDFHKKYIHFLQSTFLRKNPIPKEMKIVIDIGHGVTGAIIDEVLESLGLSCNAIILYKEVDGNFPAHSPDPSNEKAMEDLKKAVIEYRADFGIAFDGDGDRFGLVDAKGRLWCGDLLGLFFIEHMEKKNDSHFLMDIKTSQMILKRLQQNHLMTSLVPSGHSIIKDTMTKTAATFAAEVSGHFFFADDGNFLNNNVASLGFDDGIYAFIRLLNVLMSKNEFGSYLCDWYEHLPTTYVTPEWRIACSPHEKTNILQQIQSYLTNNNLPYTTIDGVRFCDARGYWIVRGSNTQDVVSIRLEGYSKKDLKSLYEQLQSIICNDVSMPLID